MTLLRVDWRPLTAVAPRAASTGEAGEDAGSAMRAEKPMMVYVTASDDTDSVTRKLEDVVFANEKFAVGAKFFDTIKISLEDANQDRMLAETGRGEAPRIVFLSRAYEVEDVLEGKRISAGKLLKSMSRLARKEYENNFDRMVSGYIKLLNELDRLEGKKANLADKKARLAEKPNASKAKKLAREEEELAADLAKWEAEEKELRAFKLKGEGAEA